MLSTQASRSEHSSVDPVSTTVRQCTSRWNADCEAEPLCLMAVVDALMGDQDRAVVLCSMAGTVLRANARFAKVVGVDTVAGQSLSMYESVLNGRAFMRNSWLQLVAGAEWEGHFWLRTSEGTSRRMYGRCVAFGGLNERPAGCWLLLTFTDDASYCRCSDRTLKQSTTTSMAIDVTAESLNTLAARLTEFCDQEKAFGIIEIAVERPAQVGNGECAGAYAKLSDRLLERIQRCGRESDIAIALSPVRYLVALSDIHSEEGMEAIALRLLQEIHRPLRIDGKVLVLAAYAGVAIYPKDGANVSDLLGYASLALSRANRRQQTGLTLVRYQREMSRDAAIRLCIERDLGEALKNRQLMVHYQPIVRLHDGVIVGVEALARWMHPQMGPIPPSKFIPLAEEMGMITEIGLWTLHEAFSFASRVNAELATPLFVSVNLSASSIPNWISAPIIDGILSVTRCEPEHIVLEVTESALTTGSDAVLAWFNTVTSRGIGVAIDDFGTGYSSLSYLKSYPISCIKIDRSFIHGLTSDRRDRALTKTIIEMAKSLETSVVAEGIESPAQVQALTAMGCQFGQGFHFERPVEESRIFGRLNLQLHAAEFGA